MNRYEQQANSSGDPKSPEQKVQQYPLEKYTQPAKTPTAGGSSESPYYQSQAPSIEVPKGGGAIKGIDEKFTVNAVNGTASLSVQVPLSPARGGFTPQLSLQYNSGAGNSVFGQGWDMSLPSIQRKTDKKLPEYNDAIDSDVFVMAGAEDLIPKLDQSGNPIIIHPKKYISSSNVDTGYHIKQYIPRTEGLYAKIEFITKDGTDASWWRVTTKDNIVTYYGLNAESRVADPANPQRVFKWLPTFSYDHKGNAQLYEYIVDDNTTITDIAGNAHELYRLRGNALFTNTFLKKISYCNSTPFYTDTDPYSVYEPSLSSLSYMMELILDYGDYQDSTSSTSDADTIVVPYAANGSIHYRKDPFSDFHAGFEIRTYRRCYRFLMFHKFDEITPEDGVDAVLVKSLNIAYHNGNDTADGVNFTETDYPVSFTSVGYALLHVIDGSPKECGYVAKSLPPVTCNYNTLAWNKTMQHVSPKDAENLPQGLTGAYQWIDLDGEGLPGILTEQAGGWFYKHNLGDGHFAPTKQVSPKPSFAGLGNNLQWQDLDGDGRRQLVSMDTAVAGYFELNDEQEWEQFRAFEHKANIDWNSPYTKILDLNGDGKPDVLLTEERAWRWYENKGTEGYANGGGAFTATNETDGPKLLHNDMLQSIFLADMNGDGMTDIVRIQNGEVCYWPNIGYGKFGAKVIMTNAPRFDTPDLFNPLYLTLSDISGTGAADIIYLGQNKCTAWVNYAGNAWGEGIVINSLPSIEPYSKIAVMDFLGSGTSCIVWSSPLPQHAHAPLRYIDLMGGNKPYLMNSYSNSMGKSTTFTYKHSTRYYIEDKLALKPWATRLPFPVQCVDTVTTEDTVSETTYTQEYRYHHGYYDHEEREFRGFGMVEVKDTDVAVIDDILELNQHPVLTKTWYHTGAFLRLGTLIEQYEEEYYNTANWNLPGIASFPANLNVQEFREAHRALKGSPLRQEVYALDQSANQNKPYTVTANSYVVKLAQNQYENRHASFFIHQQENLVWHCERGDIEDPRILHELTLSVDAYGNVLQSAKVAYKRGVTLNYVPGTNNTVSISHTGIVVDMQRTTKVTYTVNEFTNDVIDEPPTSGNWYPLDNYRLRMQKEAKVYELHGLSDPQGMWTPQGLSGAFANISSEIEFSQAPSGSSAQKRLLSRQRVVYLQDDTSAPLAFGSLGALGLVYQQYQLAFTNDILANSLAGKTDNTMLTDGGYIRENNSGITGFGSSTTNYWLPSGTMQYFTDEKNSFFAPEKFTDPWGNETTITYVGNYYMLPETVTDALSSNANVTTVVEYDWRCLQPKKIKDANDNITEIIYDELCLPIVVAMNGKVSGGVEADELGNLNPFSKADSDTQEDFWTDPATHAADLLGHATWRCVYDFSASPVAVAMIAREEHYMLNANSPLLIRITYTDGMGRVAMHKVQAEPTTIYTPCWIGSGKTVYNNKGKEVMQYEPYFTDTHAYDAAEQAANAGVSPRIHYDPLGRVKRTDMPDGSFTKTEWDAWTQKIYDNNDTVLDSVWYDNNSAHTDPNLADAAAKAAEHDNTPTVMLLDVLAQPFYTIQHNRYITSGTTWGDFYYQSYVRMDVSGNRIEIRDARTGMSSSTYMTLQYKYDMLRGVIKQVSADSGTQYLLAAADGQPYYAWDADNREFRFEYDEIRRMTLKEVDTGSLTVLERVEYGEGITNAKNNNLYGKPYKHYDGGGLLWTKTYDFKGNPLTAWRTFTTDYEAHPNWLNVGSVSMESADYVTENTFDALNRLSSITHKTHTSGGTVTNGKTNYAYDKAGLLKAVDVANISTPSGGSGNLATDIINDITYDAKGQRLSVDYENGATTTYEYYADTFRVKKILTERVVSGTPQKLQELKYWYDPVGNITTQTDGALQSVFYANTVVSPDNYYTYDALYRLIIAEGREQRNTNNAVNYNDNGRTGGSAMPFVNSTNTSDLNALQRYTQKYSYDETGNMLQMKHWADGSDRWTRDFTISNTNNRTTGSSIGSNTTGTETLSYDARGNLTGGLNHLLNGSSTHTDTMEYNAENRLQKVWVNGTTIQAFYQYDADGQRIRKVWKNTSGTILRTRLYIGDWELYTDKNYVTNAITLQRETLNVMDDQSRIALVDTPTTLPGGSSETQLLRYQFSNHLSTASLELSSTAAIISYEEYYPYGSTSFQSGRSGAEVSLKRYRYTGKERDEETGLYYHGARYYAPWLARWCASEPLNNELYNSTKGYNDVGINGSYLQQSMSSYEYVSCSPIKLMDATGERGGAGTIARPVNASQGLSNTYVSRGGNVSRGVSNQNDAHSFARDKDAIVIPGKGVFYRNSNAAGSWLERAPVPEWRKNLSYPGDEGYPTLDSGVFANPMVAWARYRAANKVNGPFASKQAEDDYRKSQQSAPLEIFTSDPYKLSDLEKANIAHRIATNKFTAQDLIYARQLNSANSKGAQRAEKFSENWAEASLSEAINKFTPDADLDLNEQKLLYSDKKTGFQIVYDRSGNYFRILNSQGQYVDLNGKQVKTGHLKGQEAKDFERQQTHFRNTDKN